MERTAFEGRVVSALHSDYLTDKYGDEQDGIKGYTLHILVDKINGEEINKHCLELQCYADYCMESSEGITYLHLIKPIYEVRGVPMTDGDIAVGESRISFKGHGFKRKVKHGREYRMLQTGLPLCQIKRPLITGSYIPDETDGYARSHGVTPIWELEAVS